MLTTKQKNLLRAYWKQTYPAVRIRKDGTVEAKKSIYTAWGVLETPEQALRSAEVLEARQVIIRKGIAYFSTYQQAETVLEEVRNRFPSARIVEYVSGYAIQYQKSGSYYPEWRIR